MDSNEDFMKGGDYINDNDSQEIIEVDDNITDKIEDMEIKNEKEDEDDDDGEDEDDEVITLKPERDDSVFVFKEHTDEVFCLSLRDVGEEMVASGGKDDCCLVWRSSDGGVVFKCTGHKESVVCVSFSHDGRYLATGDMNGVVKAWDVSSGQEVWSFEVAEVQWLRWHHKVTLLLCGAVDGNIWLWNVPHGHTKTLPNYAGSVTCGNFLPDGKRVCAGYEDGTVNIWDLKTISSLHSYPPSPRHHSSSVTCVDCHHGNIMVATGSCDGSVLIIKSSTGQLLNKFFIGLKSPASNKQKQDDDDDEEKTDERVESLAFSQSSSSNQYLAVGSSSGKVIVFDTTTSLVRFQCEGHEGDVVKVTWHPTNQDLLLSCSVDGSVVLWDVRSAQQVHSFIGHTKAILDMAVSRDGNSIYTASADNTVRIFRTTNN